MSDRDASADERDTDAFASGLAIAGRVTRPAVQQPVVPAGRAGGELAAVYECDAKPPQRQIVCKASAGCSSAHDQHVCVMSSGPSWFHLR